MPCSVRAFTRVALTASALLTASCGGGGGAGGQISSIPSVKHPQQSSSITVDGLPGTITEFPSPFEPIWVTVAPDGNAWFQSHSAVNRITADGTVTSFTTPGILQYSEFQQMALAADGAMWFTATVSPSDTPQCTSDPDCNTVARVTLNGSISRVVQSIGGFQFTGQNAVALGPNNEIWVSVCAGREPPSTINCGRSRLISLRADGTIDVDTRLPAIDNAGNGYLASSMTLGPDGDLYAAAYLGASCPPGLPTHVVFRIDGAGNVTQTFTVPDATYIATGPDKNLWVTQSLSTNKIARLTTTGSITEFDVPTPNAGPNVIAAGNDGAMWFTEFHVGQIGRITMSGAITEFPTPTKDSHPAGIASLPGEFSNGHGRIWFAEQFTDRIGKIEF